MLMRLSKLVNLDRFVRYVLQSEGLIPLWTTVIIVALDGSCAFLEADVIKAGKGGAVDVFDCVIRNQEMFLPPHKDEISFL